jgi:signal transduction histidine kinase
LRPESLVNEGLIGMLKRQCSAVYARHGVTIVTQFEHEPELPLVVKQELYRLAQEALHNAVKHAKASKVVVAIRRNGGGVMLEVTDDGIGFDPTQSFPGHLGLHSMRERVARLDGILTIKSAPGQGTSVHIQLLPK